MENKEDLLKALSELNSEFRRLKSYSTFLNRERVIKRTNVFPGTAFSEEFVDYFLDMRDDDWDIRIRVGNANFYIEINMVKPIRKTEAEKEFDNIVDRMIEIRDRLSEEHFNSHFLISFNSKPQQSLNEKTHKNDIYKYNGIGENNDIKYYDKYKNYSPEEYCLAKISYIII